jgi:hypothetical protein
MAVVSRLQLNHPALGSAGGAGLHASIEALYTKIGDNVDSRWFSITDFDQTETNDLLHNFATDMGNLQYDLYNWNGTEWVLLTDATSPLRSAFSVIEKVGSESTTLQITNNTGGNDLTFAVSIQFNNTYLSQGDIRDIDILTVAPEDGQSLVWEASTKKFKPGASGDSSFKIQGVSTPNATIKGGYLMLDDGREIATYDGSGTDDASYGTDLSINLTTIFGASPANATTYYLYLDITALGSEVTTDNGRKLYTVAAADTSKFYLSTTKPEAIKKTQYAVIGFIKSATSGTVWSGSGAAFGTVASKRYNQRKVESNNYLFDWFNAQSLGAVGNGNVTDTGNRAASTFNEWQSTNTTNISLSASSSSPLRSPINFLFSGSGNNATGTTFVESPTFQLNVADLGKPVMVSFDLADVTADGNFDVCMVRYNSSGVYQEKISIAGNASGATPASAKLPLGVTKFNGFFIASSTATDYYALRFRRLAGTDVPRLDSNKISPDTVVQGAAVTDWVSYTPTYGAGWGTVATSEMFYRRVGDSIHVKGTFVAGTVAASIASMTLPSGLLSDSTKQTINTIQPCGHWWRGTASATAPKKGVMTTATTSSNLVYFSRDDYTTAASPLATANGNALVSSTEVVGIDFVTAVTTWSSNVTMANRAVESYYYTSEAFNADGTTTVEGMDGQATTNLGATRTKTLTIPNAQPNDKFFVELRYENSSIWFDAPQLAPLSLDTGGTGISGVYISSATSTTVVVTFVRYKWAANDDTPVTDWGTNLRWRVRRVSGGASVGFPVSTANIVGRTDGTTVGSGYIGQVIEPASALVSYTLTTSEADVTNASITLTPGVWQICYSVTTEVVTGAVSGNSSYARVMVTNAANTHIGKTERILQAKATSAVANSIDASLSASCVVNISTDTTYKLRALLINSTGTGSGSLYVSSGNYECTFYAVRIA